MGVVISKIMYAAITEVCLVVVVVVENYLSFQQCNLFKKTFILSILLLYLFFD